MAEWIAFGSFGHELATALVATSLAAISTGRPLSASPIALTAGHLTRR
jgi:hypothetical protein